MQQTNSFIHPRAELDSSVEVGPFAYIGENVKIGKGCVIHHHATVDGYTTIDAGTEVFPYAFIGAKTHDLKYKGGKCCLKIGKNNVFREYTSIHTSTDDGGATCIGDNNYFLAFSHIGHDSIVKNNAIVSACVAVGGHVVIGNYANVGGNSSIHQFCQIGDYAMLGGSSFLKKDLPPFMLAVGVPAEVRSYNRIGLMRQGFSEAQLASAKKIYRTLYNEDLNRSQALERIAALAESNELSLDVVERLLAFASKSTRGLL